MSIRHAFYVEIIEKLTDHHLIRRYSVLYVVCISKTINYKTLRTFSLLSGPVCS